MQKCIPIRYFIVPLAAVSLLVCNGADTFGFHQGGVGECEGCHTIHNSFEGFAVNPFLGAAGSSGNYLLKGSDQSSVCLNCHQKSLDTGPTVFHISTPSGEMPDGIPPKQMTPGGDFGWLKKTYTWFNSIGDSTIQRSPANAHGHNIVALDYGYDMDYDTPTAPGGTYPSSSMSCISCHDPHGRYRRVDGYGTITTSALPIKGSGSLASKPEPDSSGAVGVYRLLGGSGYYPQSVGPGNAFIANPPNAVAPDTYNRSEATTQTRVAYGTGMSEWCRNCHPTIHVSTTDTFMHAAGNQAGVIQVGGALGADIAAWYDQYVNDGNLNGGNEANAFLSLVPFEIGSSDYRLVLKPIVTATPTKGPSLTDGTPAVMCLSCHRAHASGWDWAMRWNNRAPAAATTPLITTSLGSYTEGSTIAPVGQGRTEVEATAAYDNIPSSFFAAGQKPLCFKCHQTGTK